MRGKFSHLLVPALATVAVLGIQSLLAANGPDWPFRLLPRPGRTIIIVPPPNTVVVPPPNTPNDNSQQPDQLNLEDVPKGEYVAAKDLNITLSHTEGKSFKLRGEVWLDGPSPTLKYPLDEPEGFGLFLRQLDGLHRYEANSSRLRAKRRLLDGVLQTKIVPVATLPNSPLRAWIPFTLVVTRERISFTFDGHAGEIQGPLNTDGSNEIALVSGTKLRNVHLEVLDDARN